MWVRPSVRLFAECIVLELTWINHTHVYVRTYVLYVYVSMITIMMHCMDAHKGIYPCICSSLRWLSSWSRHRLQYRYSY